MRLFSYSIKGERGGFLTILLHPPLTPAFVLGLSFVGFGVLCHDSKIGLLASLYTTVFVFALPGQVVLIDQIARGLPFFSIVLAVAVTGFRLLPMTVALIPHLRGPRKTLPVDYAASHFVAVTMWIESMRRIPGLPEAMRVPYFFGLAVVLVGISVLGTIVGHLAAGSLPKPVAAGLIFLTPTYFLMGLIAPATRIRDWTPIILGIVIAPFAMWLAPAFDLAITGLAGGSLSFFIFRDKHRATVPASLLPTSRDPNAG